MAFSLFKIILLVVTIVNVTTENPAGLLCGSRTPMLENRIGD